MALFSQLRGKVGVRLLVSVLLFSSVVTLLLTAMQLYFEYDRGVARIEGQFAAINDSYLGALAEGLWRLDQEYLQIQADGILRLPDVRAVDIREMSASAAPLVVSAGRRVSEAALVREFPISYPIRGETQQIGRLRVEATLSGVYRELLASALIILASQGLKTFLVSLFILYMVHYLITRHLGALARYVGAYDLHRPPPPLALARPPPPTDDELEQLVAAFNDLCTSLQQAYGELHVREARIRQLVEGNIIGVVISEAGGQVVEANDAFLEMIGYSRADLLAGEIDWKALTPPEYLAASERAVADILAAGRCTPFEKEYFRRDGSRVPALVGGVALEESPGQIVAFVLDISQRKEAETEHLARLAAEGANRAKSEFLATMSHELRTPLNAVLGYADLLQREPGLSPRLAGGLDTIRQSGRHLLTLINDLLDLAKIESGKFDLAPEPIRLPAFLAVVADIIRVRADEKDLLFSLETPPELPEAVLADGRRLRQVLLNLLGNAVKYTDRGQVGLQVEVLERAADRVRLGFEVADTGTGIAPESLETIFQPFEQAGEARRRQGGTGLGLAISRHLVRLMGGDIAVASQPGAGSRFHFELDLPLATRAEGVVPERQPIAGYTGPRRRVLVADDVPANRAVLAYLLGGLGFTVIEAADGREALEEIGANPPDLVVMDLVMPGMDGRKAIRRLRAMPALGKLPVIAVSASTSAENMAGVSALGADRFLAKPIDPDQFLAVLGELLALEWVPAPAAAPAEANPGVEVPPAADLETLHTLARAGNMREIREWAARQQARDPRYRPFAERLDRLAANYQSRAILAWVEAELGKGGEDADGPVSPGGPPP